MVNQKLCHLNQIATEGINIILIKYPEVIAYSFEDVRPSRVAVTHRFELTFNNPCRCFPLTPLLHTFKSQALAWLCTRMVEDRCVEFHAAAYDDLEDVDWLR